MAEYCNFRKKDIALDVPFSQLAVISVGPCKKYPHAPGAWGYCT